LGRVDLHGEIDINLAALNISRVKDCRKALINFTLDMFAYPGSTFDLQPMKATSP
jgi:hypothetical protein